MSDVFERLRAANPVSDHTQPDLDEFLRRLDERTAEESSPIRTDKADVSGWRRARPSVRSRLIAASTIAVAIVLAIAAVVSHTGGGISLVQRAYAATDSAGGIVYYVTSTRSSSGSGARSSSSESRAQVWRSELRSRRLETSTTELHNGPAQQGGSYEEVDQRVAGGELSSTYSPPPRNTVFKGFLAFRGSTSPESVNCRRSPSCAVTTEDPVLALRELYAAGRLHEAGHARLNGKTLTVLEGNGAVRTQPSVRFIRLNPSSRILVDPKTGAPVELITHYGRQLGALTSTTIFHTYKHLALTPQTERLLSFRAHPHARLECVLALHCSDRESHGLDIGHT